VEFLQLRQLLCRFFIPAWQSSIKPLGLIGLKGTCALPVAKTALC
jgi:hypothetical protein